MDQQIRLFEKCALEGVGHLSPKYGVWDWDLGENMIYADETAARIFGVTPEVARSGLSPDAYFGCIHQDDRQTIIDHSYRSISTFGVCADNFRLVGPAGNKWVHSQGRCFAGRDNKPKCFIGLVAEIGAPTEVERRDASSPSGGVDDDLIYLCLHARRIAAADKRPFLAYLLDLAVAEVTQSAVLSSN